MHHEPTCPRCGDPVRAPGLWSSDWQCPRHGAVAPYHVMQHAGHDALDHVVARAGVPVWLAPGLPGAWVCSGVAYAGDERSPARATVTCAVGPGPLGGGAELVLVAEEPGVGLGSRHAGLAEPDPGPGFGVGAPDAKVIADGHPSPLWSLGVDGDRAAFAGEAKGVWLWVVVHPAAAGVLLYDDPMLVDFREQAVSSDLEFGSVSQRLFG